MDSEALRALVVVAAQLSGYHVPAAQLQVEPVNADVMAGLACRGRANCRVYALYQDHDVIFIREDLTPKATDHVLVHEIVHWLQHHSGKFSLRPDACVDIARRETEAYRVQNRYVAEIQQDIGSYPPPNFTCAP